MRRSVILLMVLLMSLPVSAQYVIEKTPIVISIDKKVIADCKHSDSLCYSLPVKRNYLDQTLILLFPQGGTNSYIHLYYDTDYYKYRKDPVYLDYKVRRNDEKKILDGQPLTLNLTSMPDGDYILRYSSCAFGGLMKIALTTHH